MKQGEKLTDSAVRWAKQSLIAGSHPRAVARTLRVSLNTVIRMRDGDTYVHVVVPGEESLRPQLAWAEEPPRDVVVGKEPKFALPPRNEALERESLRLLGLNMDGTKIGLSDGPKMATDEEEEKFKAEMRALGVDL